MLIQAKSLFGINEVVGQDTMSDDPICLVISQNQIDALLRNNKVQDFDTNIVRALVQGEVVNWMGFKIRRSQLLPIDSNNVRTCYAYVRSGVKFAAGTDFATMMDILPQGNHRLQIRSKWRIGATRMEEEKVVRIYCDEDDISGDN